MVTVSHDAFLLHRLFVCASHQLTSTNGALCVINPLYLWEHGDDWLTRRTSTTTGATQASVYKRERRLSTTRTWAGSGLQTKRAISLDQEVSAANLETAGEDLVFFICGQGIYYLSHSKHTFSASCGDV